uniref:Uncharacterized protein n=1 Tax=Leersia perrieri TaxID=77586 RepID=A0A0D9WCS5_9ORYZ
MEHPHMSLGGFCIMLFKKSWRIAYFRMFDNMYDKMYVLFVVYWAGLTRTTTEN